MLFVTFLDQGKVQCSWNEAPYTWYQSYPSAWVRNPNFNERLLVHSPLISSYPLKTKYAVTHWPNIKGNKLVNWERAMQCLSGCGSRGYCSPEQNCTQKDHWVIIQLIPSTLSATWAANSLLFWKTGKLPLPSHTCPGCTPVSTVCLGGRPLVQPTDVPVPSLIPFLPQDPLLPLILHTPPPPSFPGFGEWVRGLSEGIALQLAGGWSSCFFISQAGRIHPHILLPAVYLSVRLSSVLAALYWEFWWGKLSPQLAFPNNAHSPQFRWVWWDFMSALLADPADSQGSAFSLVLKEKLHF